MLVLFVVFTFRTFQFFPGFLYIQEAWIIIMSGLLIFPYLYWKAIRKLKMNAFELYVLFVIVSIPILCGYAAWREYEQPFLYGVLSQRNNLLAVGALVLLFGIKNNIITIKGTNDALIISSWGLLGLYIFMIIFLDPVAYIDYGIGFVTGGVFEPVAFKFRKELIVFGFFYYALTGFKNKTTRHWMLASLFLAFIIYDGGRAQLVSVAASLVFFVWRWGNFNQISNLAFKIIFIVLILSVLIYSTNAEFITKKLGKYNAAFTVLTTGEETKDISANARIFETAIAIPYIQKHWLLGNGSISHQWKGGYEKILGGYFHPSDIGIFGMVFMYGIFGTLIFFVQFVFAYNYSRKIASYRVHSPLKDAINGFLLYFLIYSLVTGHFAHYSEISLFFVALLNVLLWSLRKSFNSNYAQSMRVRNGLA